VNDVKNKYVVVLKMYDLDSMILYHCVDGGWMTGINSMNVKYFDTKDEAEILMKEQETAWMNNPNITVYIEEVS